MYCIVLNTFFFFFRDLLLLKQVSSHSVVAAVHAVLKTRQLVDHNYNFYVFPGPAWTNQQKNVDAGRFFILSMSRRYCQIQWVRSQRVVVSEHSRLRKLTSLRRNVHSWVDIVQSKRWAGISPTSCLWPAVVFVRDSLFCAGLVICLLAGAYYDAFFVGSAKLVWFSYYRLSFYGELKEK